MNKLKLKLCAAAVTGASLVAGAVALAAPAEAATVNAAHIDIVSIICTPKSTAPGYTLSLGTNIEQGSSETFVPAAQSSSYEFHYNVASSYVNYVTTAGSAGYYNVANDEAEQTSIPWIGFAYDEDNDCSGKTLPNITIKLTKASGTNRIYANPAAGVLDTDANPQPSITLSRGAHQHTVWRYYAPSKSAQSYKPIFTVNGAGFSNATIAPTISVG